MDDTVMLSIRLPVQVVERLEALVESRPGLAVAIGRSRLTRADVIRLALAMGLDHLEGGRSDVGTDRSVGG